MAIPASFKQLLIKSCHRLTSAAVTLLSLAKVQIRIGGAKSASGCAITTKTTFAAEYFSKQAAHFSQRTAKTKDFVVSCVELSFWNYGRRIF